MMERANKSVHITMNKKTLKVVNEVEEMKKNPSACKSYKNVDEMMKDLLD